MAENKENLKESSLTIEEMLDKLDDTTKKLESGELGLEESFSLYKEGMDLVLKCEQEIDTVEKKVLVLDKNGETHDFS